MRKCHLATTIAILLSGALSFSACALAPSGIKNTLEKKDAEIAFRLESMRKAWHDKGNLSDIRDADLMAQMALHEKGLLTGDILVDFSTFRTLDIFKHSAVITMLLRDWHGTPVRKNIVLSPEGVETAQYGVLEGDFQDNTIIAEDFEEQLQSFWKQRLREDAQKELKDRQVLAYPPLGPEARIARGPYQMLLQPLITNKPLHDKPKEIVAYNHAKGKFTWSMTYPEQELARATLNGRNWRFIANKYPWLDTHSSMVCDSWRPQILVAEDILDFLRLQQQRSIRGFFNGWGAGASVNDMHIQTFFGEDNLPIDRIREVSLGQQGDVELGILDHSHANLVFRSNDIAALAQTVGKLVQDFRAQNIPHDVIFLHGRIVVFPHNNNPDRDVKKFFEKVLKGGPGTVGGLELLGTISCLANNRDEVLGIDPEDLGHMFHANELDSFIFVRVAQSTFRKQLAMKLDKALRVRPLLPILQTNVRSQELVSDFAVCISL